MRPRSDDHLLTVREDLSEVQLTRRRGAQQAAGGVNRILHAGALRQPNQPRSAHRSQYMDHNAGARGGKS